MLEPVADEADITEGADSGSLDLPVAETTGDIDSGLLDLPAVETTGDTEKDALLRPEKPQALHSADKDNSLLTEMKLQTDLLKQIADKEGLS